MTDKNINDKPIRIFLVDDHAVVREGMRAFIQIKPDMEVVGEAADGIEALEKARDLDPDVILLDIVMPRLDGIGTIEGLKEQGSQARILVITSFAEDEQVFPAIKAGASGYLLKDTTSAELIEAIRQVHRGEPALHPDIARMMLAEIGQASEEDKLTPDPLTTRELEVLALVAQGKSNKQIAEELSISAETARTHVNRILSKLHVANRVQATLYALRQGISSLEDAG